MAAADDSSNEDGNSSGDDDDDESSKPVKHISGDDLGDSFSNNAKLKTKAVWIDDILGKKSAIDTEKEDASSSGDDDDEDDDDEDEDEEEAEGSDEDNGEFKKAQSLKDWEQSDDDDVETNLEDEEDDGDDGEEEDEDEDDDDVRVDKKILESRGKQKVKTSDKDDVHQNKELPYTIEAPKDFEEFSALLENRSNDQIVEAIRRIRTFNAIAVAAENRKKMQVCHFILVLC